MYYEAGGGTLLHIYETSASTPGRRNSYGIQPRASA